MPPRSWLGFVRCALALGAFLASIPARAQDSGDKSPLVTAETPVPFGFNYGEVETTRAAALGGAMRAAGNGTTAVFTNPANMPLTRLYHIEALGTVVPEFGRQVYGGVIVDSITSKLAGGVAVTGGFLDLGDAKTSLDRSFIDVRVALAYPIADVFNIGLGGRYLKVTQDGLGPLGDSKVSGGLKDPEGDGRLSFMGLPTFDAGVTLKLADIVLIGASGQNLTFPDNAMLPTTFGGGVAVATEDFTIEADGVADFNSYGEVTGRIMGGGEYLLLDHVPLRAGYRYDQGADSHAVSGGVGYIAREFMVEASVRRTIVGPEATTIFFQVGYFLESSGLTASPDEPAP
jgi:hypothetical protein